MKTLIHAFRTWLGARLLHWALDVLPPSEAERIGTRRGLLEQRLYDRYEAYAQLEGVRPVPFESWREQWNWLQVKAKSMTAVQP
jgi:hypothetical protein